MTELERLLIELHKARAGGDAVALSLTLRDDGPLFVVLHVRGNEVIDVLGTGSSPEEACRAALNLADPLLR